MLFRSAVMGAVMAIILCGITGLVAPFVIRYLTPADYHSATGYLPLFLVAIALKICSEYLNIGCFIKTQSYQQMMIDIINEYDPPKELINNYFEN